MEQDPQWEKIPLNTLMNALRLISTPKIRVITYVMSEAVKFDNIYIGTYDDICKATGISYTTVAETMKLMITNKLFLQKSQGVYMVNTDSQI